MTRTTARTFKGTSNILTVLISCFSIVAFGDILRYGTEDAPISGTVEVSAGTMATGVEAYIAEGGSLVLTNGDLRLDAPMEGILPEIAIHGGVMRFANDISAPDGLLMRGFGDKVIIREEFYPQAYNHSPTASLFAAGKNIDDYVLSRGRFIKRISEGPTVGYPYVVRRSPGELTFEMQYVDDWLRSAKVRLFQVGSDIYTQVLWARYASKTKGYGYSLDAPGSYNGEEEIHSKTHVPINDTQIMYGIHTLVLIRRADKDNMSAISCGLSVSGNLVFDGLDVSLEGDRAVVGASSVPISVSNSTLRVRCDTETDLRSSLTVSDAEIAFGGTDDKEGQSGVFETIGNTKKTLLSDVLISDIEITGAYFRQGSGSAAIGANGWFGYCERDCGTITFQAQGKEDNYLKCALVRISQEGSNIVGQVIGMPYNLATTPLGTDMRISANVKGQGSYYGATNITYNLTRKKSSLHLSGTAVSGTGANAVVESNALVYVDSRFALPVSTQGVVTVERGGEMVWRAGSANAKQLPALCVRGRLQYQRYGCVDGMNFEIDGGEMALFHLGENNSTSESGVYLNSMTFLDGAQLVGRRPRIGHDGNCTWTVEGSSPSWWKSGGFLVGTGNASSEGTRSFTVHVEDVTGDEAADFISLPASFSGYADSLFTDYNSSSYARLKIIKTGAGKWEWRARGGTWTGRLVLNAGAVKFTKSNSLASNGLGLKLDGGELQLADGTTNSVPKLIVSADSMLSLGAECVMEFPECDTRLLSGTDISTGVKLAVKGPEVRIGQRTGVKFGVSACLSDEVLRQISYNDVCVRQDSDGWLVPTSKGLILYVK